MTGRRYSMYRYGRNHYAIDCEDCNRKVANLRTDSKPRKILTQLATHDRQPEHPPRQHVERGGNAQILELRLTATTPDGEETSRSWVPVLPPGYLLLVEVLANGLNVGTLRYSLRGAEL